MLCVFRPPLGAVEVLSVLLSQQNGWSYSKEELGSPDKAVAPLPQGSVSLEPRVGDAGTATASDAAAPQHSRDHFLFAFSPEIKQVAGSSKLDNIDLYMFCLFLKYLLERQS